MNELGIGCGMTSALVVMMVMLALTAGLVYFGVGPLPGKMLAVAQAAYKETIRQPLFWFLIVFMLAIMGFSILLPYFTLGEDLKMLKELQLSAILLPPLVLVLFTGAMSVAEEIEGRTAVTLLSKPIARRDFLLGKYFGILAASLVMILILTFAMGCAINMKIDYDRLQEDMESQPEHATYIRAYYDVKQASEKLPEVLQAPVVYTMRVFMVIGLLAAGPFCHFCQVAIMTALTIALATRLPFALNLFVCLVIFFIGNLIPVFIAQSQEIPLVKFVAELFGLLLPSLNMYKLEPNIASGIVTVPWGAYTLQTAIHAVLFCTIAMLMGLLLFEDRDVA